MRLLATPSPAARVTASLLVALAAGAACGGKGDAKSAPLAETCAVELAPRASAAPRPPSPDPPAATSPSRLVTHAELRLATLKSELEARIGRRLAEERGRDIGVAGSLNYTVDRGPFTVAVEGDSLVVKADVVARAEACAKGRCYASCEPAAVARAAVPLRLLPDYRFAPSRVTATFTRGCVIRALGGFLKVDVTPAIQSQLAPSLRRVEQEIDGKLPKIRPQAERLWAELSKPRPLPLGGCVVVDPRGIVEGPVSGGPDALRVRFGLVAAPEVRRRCGTPPAARPLPPLTQDPALPAEDDVVLAMVAPLSAVASALEGAEPFDLRGARARVGKASVTSGGRSVDVDLGLRGEACGDVSLRAGLAWSGDGKSLVLANASPLPGEAERLSGASLDARALAAALATGPRVAPPMAVDGLDALVPELASSLSDASVEISAKVSPAKPADAAARGDDLVAWVKMRGSVTLKQR